MRKKSARKDSADDVDLLVVTLWRETLGGAAAYGNFFAEGGDSLLATRFVSRVSESLGLNLSTRIMFESPTLEALTAAVRRELVSAPMRVPEKSVNEGTASARLSFSQERMWFMHALAAESAAYNIPLALQLRGPLDVRRLQAALNNVVARHPVLSTTFPAGESGPTLQRGPLSSVALDEIQLDASVAGGRAALDRCLAELTAEPFDLARGPLLRLTLIHVAPGEAVLLWVLHHIIGDQWSFDVLVRELAASYAARSAADALAPPGDYERYAAWHRVWFTQHRLRTELAFWRDELAGLEPISLTGDYPRPPQPTFRGAKVRMPLEELDLPALQNLATSRGASLAMVLLAALNVLLYRHTGRTDVAVGVPVANRHLPGSENLVGVLVNTLVARTSLVGNPDFGAVVDRVRACMLDIFDHQNMPFELLVRELSLSRDGNRSPLFSVMFNMLNTPPGMVDFGDIVCRRLDFDKRASQFDLTVTVDAIHDRSICFEYSTDIFTRTTIERLSSHYMRILQSALRDATAPIATLPMLPKNEVELLSSWGTGPAIADSGMTIPELLETSFRRVPKALAVRSGDESFTYEQLDAASQHIARALRRRGLGRGERVGLCLWRSPLALVAQLGILRSGAAYVPLDSSYPAERLAYIAEDSGLRAVITEAGLLPALARAHLSADLLTIDSMFVAEEPGVDDDNQEGGAAPRDPAYLIYTSGSTGNPKGVEVPHSAVVNFLRSMVLEPGIAETDRLLAVTTLSFDISVLELLLPLAVGAQVVVARRDQLADGAALAELIGSTGATVMQATPSTWRILIDSGWAGSAALKALVGGEVLTRQLAGELVARCGEVWNMYGPTETTVWSTCWRVDPKQLDAISIGGPIANTEVHVLDANLQQVPIGAMGELFIGGAGVAIGYRNQPELTAKRFLADMKGARPGERIYRTGDRARWRHDGTLELMGRLDSQVKIRGHRIELGEIEARLTEHPDVAGVVARVTQDDRGDPCIVAYVVPRADMPETHVLRAYLQEWLPSYMVPQYFVELDAIPLLANGKIDRVGLASASIDVRNSRSTTAPRNEGESAIHRVWTGVLGNDRFGVNESFFDVGGHSLLAVLVATRIARELRRPCPLPLLFRYPTIATLAAALEPTPSQRDGSVVTLQSAGDGPPVFCISGVDLYQSVANELAPGFPVYGMFSQVEAAHWANVDRASASSVSELAADYVATIRDMHPSGPYVLVGFSFGGVIAYEMAQQLVNAAVDVPLLVILDSDPPSLADGSSVATRTTVIRPVQDGAKALLSRLGRRLGASAFVQNPRRQQYLDAMQDYRALPYTGCALLIESAEGRAYDPGHGWDLLIPNLKIRRVAAAHTEILQPPHVADWASELRALLTPR
jgi:amino acid adenylation domain-containing protein